MIDFINSFEHCGSSLTEVVSNLVDWDKKRHELGRMDDFTKTKICNSLKCSFTCVPDKKGYTPDRRKEFFTSNNNPSSISQLENKQ